MPFTKSADNTEEICNNTNPNETHQSRSVFYVDYESQSGGQGGMMLGRAG